MNNAEKIEKLLNKYFKANQQTVEQNDERDKRTVDSAVTAYKNSNKTARTDMSPGAWRIIMESKMTKIAVAAVIIVAVLTGIYLGGGSIDGSNIAWADVIEPILNAKTASMDIVIGSGDKKVVIHDEIMGSLIRRTTPELSNANTIIDLENMKVMVIEPEKKTVVYVELEGLGEIKNYLETLKNVVTRLEGNPQFEVENQGIQNVDGIEYVVFVAKVNDETVTILVDPETAVPVSIVHDTPNMRVAADNLKFDVELDDSRFNMEVPQGYKIQQAGIDFKDNSEAGFIETLRIWAEIIEDGQFPESIALEDVVKVGPKFDEGLKRAQLTDDEQMKIATKFGQGLVFIRFFKGQGQWHWAGKGVKLGDGETPIFWYQPKDSQTFRVIYGDLSVKDVAEGDLPK